MPSRDRPLSYLPTRSEDPRWVSFNGTGNGVSWQSGKPGKIDLYSGSSVLPAPLRPPRLAALLAHANDLGLSSSFYEKNESNLIAIPYDNDGSEPGDNYDIVSHYENVLGIKFYVTEKLDPTHKFFEDFGLPTNDFTEYHFDDKTRFLRKV
mgnify:CR=1 FL=1